MPAWQFSAPFVFLFAIIACGSGNGPGNTDPVLTPRSGVVMAYDEARHQTVLFGGATVDGLSNETWVWNGTAWSRAAESGPPGRIGAGMVYDASRQRIVLYGGRTSGQQGATVYSDTWEWDGSDWTQVSSTGPGPRIHFALGYDRSRQVTTLFGGVSTSGTSLPDVWEWNGEQWTHQVPTPVNNFVPFLAYDETAARLVLVTSRVNDLQFLTSEWDGSAFGPATAAGPRMMAGGLTTLGGGGGVLAVGGFDGTNFTHQTWIWNGTTWTQKSGPGPSAREVFGLSFDRDRSRVVLFGGDDASGTRLADTWEFDGTSWSHR